MYVVAVKQDFIAQHYLVGGDWGPENHKHSHHYQVEVQMEGDVLDQHGYLMDIVDIQKHLGVLVAYWSDRTLNDLPEFKGENPSLERFSWIFCRMLEQRIDVPNLRAITIKLWENDIAWASFRKVF